jgi:PadR family transcriptional regulator PadR
MSDDGPLGAFEEQVMIAVLHASEEAYGMNVRREIEDRASREVTIGAVYATLDRLEEKGLVTSRRTIASGAARRVFRVTAAGRAALVETRRMRERLWMGIDLRRLGTSGAT